MTQTVLITGAGRGLGLALTQVFLEAGLRVVAGERKPSRELDRLKAAHEARLSRVTLDQSSTESVRSAAAEVASALDGGLNVLINNAAILPSAGRGTLEALDVDAGLEVLDINALGPLRVTQAFLSLLERGQRKLIVNVSSEAGSIGDCWRKDDFPYCMSKAALNMQSALLQNALSPRGFQLLAVHPGWIRSDMGGPKADLAPKAAAEALFSLITNLRADAPLFVDYTGKELKF
jgi:NAD(P)-dependent dehydrogenase (short-subunit alcohol dehydrogenase family)